jgi:hypothetical protein
MQRTLRARVIATMGAVALAAGLTAGLTGSATAAPSPSQSDGRADMVIGNVTTCAGLNLGNDIQVGSSSDSNASDANVSGVVKTNAGTTQPGVGEEVDISLLTGTVVIDAVVVKGGPAYNVYSKSAVLPPTLPPDQHYISPLNGGGNVPTISHWFVCYHLGAPPAAGSLVVSKVVGAPAGTPVIPLPTSYSALVTCTPPGQQAFTSTVTFGAGGGVGTASPPLDNLDVGTVCTVVEQNTSGFDPATKIVYDPTGADSPGVEIPDSEVGVTVQITNDFSGVQVESEVVTPVTPDAPVTPVTVAAAAVVATPGFTG